jgi:Tfp pilus assembly protein PilF
MSPSMRRVLLAILLLGSISGCGVMAVEHRGDALFRKALASQLAYDEPRAEALYRDILKLGLDWSPVWNNLAVIAVHHHEYSVGRKLLAQAVAANERDVVALTNYGVISYHLYDFEVARKTLAEARALRRRIIDSIPPEGRSSWEEEQYARATESLERTAQKYLARIERATSLHEQPPPADLTADLQLHDPSQDPPRHTVVASRH